MCVIVVTMRGWADVSLWVAVCFLAKISLHWLHVKPRLHAWHSTSHGQSRRYFAFPSLSDQWERRLFFIFETVFYTKLLFPLPWWSKWTSCRWRSVNFEIHMWSSSMNADCIWRSISIQHVQREAELNSDPRNDSFWVEIRDAKHVDQSTHQCRTT